tara:strand:+ start:33347 stop:33508 length:162 start_codon:yes stop_codon:yes gene_type:complete
MIIKKQNTIQEDARNLFSAAADNISNDSSIDNTIETVELFLEKLPEVLRRMRN